MAVIMLAVVMASISFVPASATGVTMTVEKQQIRVKMVLSLQQNMTTFPNQTGTVSAVQDPNLSTAFTEALRKSDPKASVSDLSLNFTATKHWLNITTQMTVMGVTEKGETSQA